MDDDEKTPIKESKVMTNSIHKLSMSGSIIVTDYKDDKNKPATFEKSNVSIVDL